nr:MAG TPA_asm: Integrase [Caudoviricetes sp.]
MARGRPATPLGSHGEIRLRVQDSGKYQADTLLRLANGKIVRVRATGKTKTAARRALEKRCHDRLAGDDTDTLTTDSPLAQLLDEWLPQHPVGESTKTTYMKCIRLHIVPGLGAVRLNEIGTPLVQKFLNSLTPGTVRTARAILSSSLGLAVRWGLMANNPVRDTVMPRREKQDVRVLTDDEMDEYRARLVAWCGTNGHGPARGEGLVEIIDVIRGSGVRIGEALALRWQDVDLENGRITITGTTDERGGRQGIPKTEKSNRTIPVTAGAVDALRRQRMKPYAAVLGEPVFPTRTGNYRTVNNTETRLRKARGDLDVRPHHFRKTVSTRIEAKYGLLAASRYLGHSSTKVTEQAYLGRPEVIDDYTDAI